MEDYIVVFQILIKKNTMSIDTDLKYQVDRRLNIIQSYLLLKNQLIEKLLGTDLYPYVLNMQYLVGELEHYMLTDSPTKFWPYLKGDKGINRLNNSNLTESVLSDWVTFEKVKEIPNRFQSTDKLEMFLIFKIQGNDLKYMFFSIYKENVINQEKTIELLNKEPDIIMSKNVHKKYMEILNTDGEE